VKSVHSGEPAELYKSQFCYDIFRAMHIAGISIHYMRLDLDYSK